MKTISYVMDIPNISLEYKKAISRAVYTTEHQLLSMEYAQGDQYNDPAPRISPLSYAFLLAALLYFEVIIREHPYISKVHHRLVCKLDTFLSETDPACYGFGSLPDRDVLLWIMFVKLMTSPETGRDSWTMNQPCENLETEKDKRDVLRERLKRIAWRDGVCDYHLGRIWKELGITIPDY